MKRKKIGDVIEFKVRGGVAFALYTHQHPEFGSLIRVWNRVYESGFYDLEALVREEPSFTCFFPLGGALVRGIVRVAANVAIPKSLMTFPTFRTTSVGVDGSVKSWWLWDGTTSVRIGSLTNTQAKLPMRGIWNDTMVIARIEKGWADATAEF